MGKTRSLVTHQLRVRTAGVSFVYNYISTIPIAQVKLKKQQKGETPFLKKIIFLFKRQDAQQHILVPVSSGYFILEKAPSGSGLTLPTFRIHGMRYYILWHTYIHILYTALTRISTPLIVLARFIHLPIISDIFYVI